MARFARWDQSIPTSEGNTMKPKRKTPKTAKPTPARAKTRSLPLKTHVTAGSADATTDARDKIPMTPPDGT
jgi:hypothetical protein